MVFRSGLPKVGKGQAGAWRLHRFSCVSGVDQRSRGERETCVFTD